MKTFLFDLDGTLLKMDVDTFTKVYIGSLANYFKAKVEPELMAKALWASVKAMVKNDGSKTNEMVFLDTFNALTNQDFVSDDFINYYHEEFEKTIVSCTVDNEARELIDILKAKGYRLVLATNPIFPKIATLTRMSFVGLKEEDFDYISTYENAHFAKPNINYYKEILNNINETADNCIMVGNDADEDMIVKEALGIETYMITNCLLNKSNKPIDADFVGTMQDLIAYVKGL